MAESDLQFAQPPSRPPRYSSLCATDERLSLSFPRRLLYSSSIAALSGFCLGAAHGSTEAGYRFRAENAHRLPSSQAGWYLYHKSKNYKAMFGGLIEGSKMMARVTSWVVLFVGLEEGIDGFRQGITRATRGEEAAEHVSKDFLSTVVAGLGTAGAFSLWHRFPLAAAARTARTGVKVGLAYGLLEDAAGLVRGRRIGYVEFTKRIILGSGETARSTASHAVK